MAWHWILLPTITNLKTTSMLHMRGYVYKLVANFS